MPRDPMTVVFEHCAATLPDSLSARKELLHALEAALLSTHPAALSVKAQLAAIETIERLQEDLPLKFREE